MPLNLITDEGAQQLADYYQKSLQDKNNQAIDRYEAYFALGLLAWRANDQKSLSAFLKSAAVEVVAIVDARDVANVKAERIPHSVALPFLVVINFSDESTIKKLAEVKRKQWFQPETDNYKPLADLLDILRHYFAGVPLDERALQALVQLNKYPGTDLFYKPLVASLSKGLLAIVQNNVAEAQVQLNALLDQHDNLAFEGAWKKLVEGLLSFWALTLSAVAKKEGVELGIISPYFPQ